MFVMYVLGFRSIEFRIGVISVLFDEALSTWQVFSYGLICPPRVDAAIFVRLPTLIVKAVTVQSDIHSS